MNSYKRYEEVSIEFTLWQHRRLLVQKSLMAAALVGAEFDFNGWAEILLEDLGFKPGVDAAKEALSNNNGSGVSEAPMPSPDLGEGKEK